MANGAIIGQVPNLSKYATKDDLNSYVPTSSIVTNVQQGNNNPVSSGAVYDYVQNSVGDLPWKLLDSKSNVTSTISYTVSITQPIQFLKFHITGVGSKSGTGTTSPTIEIGRFSAIYQSFTSYSGTINVDSLLTSAIWFDDEKLYGFDGSILVENNSMQINLSVPSVLTANINCDIYYM